MKLFDEVTHLEVSMKADEKLAGYVDIYGSENWPEMADCFFYYKGFPVLPVYEVRRYSEHYNYYKYFGVLKYWMHYSENVSFYDDGVDGIQLFSFKTSNAGERRGYNAFTKGLMMTYSYRRSTRETIAFTLDYYRLRLKRLWKKTFK